MPELIITVGIRDTQPVIDRALSLGRKHRVKVEYDVSHGSLVNSLRLRYSGEPPQLQTWLTDLLDQSRIIASQGVKERQLSGDSGRSVLTKWHWVWICALALVGGVAVALLMEVL